MIKVVIMGFREKVRIARRLPPLRIGGQAPIFRPSVRVAQVTEWPLSMTRGGAREPMHTSTSVRPAPSLE
ncbi:hypothetical protein SCWH03_24670 [Streptomyces pacificus]|uniref:Uncharacterized protein n=1 Tax=Streptomyces pacificus TaxID=2705029 RepID=A0A6A0AV50_9ACTN|nr:hypothetical protein SCWH03_24670 [Streptomyces pacificus]